MSENEPVVTVIQNASKPQFDIIVDGEVVGLTRYEDVGDDIRRYVHTEIDPQQRGHDYGSVLVGSALDAERAAGRKIVPLCPFVKQFIADNPDYADLVAPVDPGSSDPSQ